VLRGGAAEAAEAAGAGAGAGAGGTGSQVGKSVQFSGSKVPGYRCRPEA